MGNSNMLYLFIYTNKPDSAKLRKQFEQEHHAFRRGLGDKLKVAGPRFAGDEDQSVGSMVILEADNIEAAKKIVESDPYLVEGVFSLDSVSRINPRCWVNVEIT